MKYNLLDHICCILENKMQPDDDFEECYKREIGNFYAENLNEIETETSNLLAFKNYYAMKKTMIRSGVVAAILFSLGAILKILFFPGATLTFVSAIFVLTFIFFPLLFILKAKEVNKGLDKLLLALAAVLGIMICINGLFTILYYPFANTLWKIIIAVIVFVFTPWYYLSGVRRPDTKINTIVITIIIVCFTGLLFLFTRSTPVNVGKQSHAQAFISNTLLLEKLINKNQAYQKRITEYLPANEIW